MFLRNSENFFWWSMQRGRKPESPEKKAQKAAVRSARRKPDVATQSATIAAGTEPPAWLKDEGLKIWNRLAPTLRAVKLLSAADTETFGRYCRNFARWLKMQNTLDAEGETYETETYGGGGEGAAPERVTKLKRVNPAFGIADRLERQLLAAEDRFGLNPAERQRIMAARAQTGAGADLFGNDKGNERRPGDPAAKATNAAEPIDSPIGLLN